MALQLAGNPSLTESVLLQILESEACVRRFQKAERDEAASHGVSVDHLRQARAERDAADQATARALDLDRARAAFGLIQADGPESPIGRLRSALRTWDGAWPPTQSAILPLVKWKDERSVRSACSRAHPPTTWTAELAAAERERGG